MTSIWAGEALLATGWARGVRIGIADGVIASVERDVPARPADMHAGILLPGLPNLHSHAFQRAMAGLTERRGAKGDSFWTWREWMYRFVERLRPEDVEAIAALAYAEMLECGFTRVGEFHYLHHGPDGRPYADPAEMAGAIAAAAAETGIALTLLPVFYARGGFGGRPVEPGQRRFATDPDGYARLHAASRRAVAGLPDAVVGIAPHSLRAVTPQDLAGVLPLAGGGPIHIHVAEQLREVDESLSVLGARPVEWLLANAPVDARWCTIHATHMTDGEAQALARCGAVAGLCPITEANLGDGLFAAAPFLEAGGAYGVGTDSNVLIDAWEELRLLEYGQRLIRHQRNVLADGPERSTGGTLFRSALAGGARALGATGGIVPGAPADLVELSSGEPSFIGRSGDGLLDALVFAGARRAIARVWRRGALVVEGGRHRARERIERRYAAVLRQLLA